jgi:hypothetical protein
MTIPTVAMVDAFVGGVSIVMVITILSSLASIQIGSVPQPNVSVSCGSERDQVQIEEVNGRTASNIADLPANLARRAPPDALSLRILVQTTAENTVCFLLVQKILTEANVANDMRNLNFTAPVFLVDVNYRHVANAQR